MARRVYKRTRNYVPIPQSTNFRLIFPYITTLGGFNSSFYNPGLTDERVTTEEVKVILEELSVVPEGNNFRTRKFVCYFIVVFIVGMIGLSIGMPLLMLSNNTNYLPYLIVGFVVWIILSLLCFAFSLWRLQNKSIKDGEAIIKKYKESFAERGLRWNIPSEFPRWIELWKDYVQTQHLNITIPTIYQHLHETNSVITSQTFEVQS